MEPINPHRPEGHRMHPDCQYPSEWHAAEEAAEQAWLDEYIRAHRSIILAS